MLCNKLAWKQCSRQVIALRYKSASSDNDQFIQRSKVPSMHFQDSLPRLPIPELYKTCSRYLRAQKPILSGNDYERVEKIVRHFEKNEGPQLQKELVHRDKMNSQTSYISAPWFDMYLSDRKPLPLNSNPGLVVVNDPKPEFNNQLIRSVNVIISTMRFMKSLRAGVLEPEVFHLNPKKSDTKLFRTVTGLLPSSISWYGAYLFKAFPLDMSQYKNLFNTSRIPKTDKDELYYDPSQRHVMIMKGGNVYSLDLLDDNGCIIDSNTIFDCIHFILNDSKSPSEHPVGILTTMERNRWARARKHLEDIGNKELLKMIDGSLFTFILDNEEPESYEDITHHFLHSDGCNRWFDKCFSLIITKNGLTGFNFEHSWGDGVAVLRYVKELYKDSTENPRIHHSAKPSENSPKSLVKQWDFILDDKIKNEILNAKKEYKKVTDSLCIDLVDYHKMGRKFAKRVNISPDFITQIAFQVAQFKLSGKHVGTYESCSTSAFKHGRTETMRPCTIESAELCKALLSRSRPDKSELIKMMSGCSDVHSNLIKEAAMGQGFDRHLFALRLIGNEKGMSLDLYNDPSYAFLNHYILSTSTLSAEILLIGAFGPVVSDGYGVGYSLFNERLGAVISSYKNAAHGKDFSDAIVETLDDLHNILS